LRLCVFARALPFESSSLRVQPASFPPPRTRRGFRWMVRAVPLPARLTARFADPRMRKIIRGRSIDATRAEFSLYIRVGLRTFLNGFAALTSRSSRTAETVMHSPLPV
jgi:hypothetical protein